MENSEIVPLPLKELAAETNVYLGYLAKLGLPTDNVIATTKERNIVATNLVTFIAELDPDEKRDARYLSKFLGATAVGLFDAALNYVWNEVVLNLRKKVAVYGIDLFFDAAVGAKQRDAYKDEEDLAGLKDSVLLDTCKKLEIISETVYLKVDHVLTMRNEVAASHPNVASIGGFELLGWLQTCVKEVLQDRPSESAIKIRAFIDNLKSSADVIDSRSVARFTGALKDLSLPHVHNLVISLFGIFVSPDTDQILKKNVALLAPAVWEHAEDKVKFKVGATVDGYRTNLNKGRLVAGEEFLKIVGGRSYETIDAKIIALQNLSDQLSEAHHGHDNFWNEPPIAKEILSYFQNSTDIPEAVLSKLAHVILSCRIGRGLSYRDGVSPGGLPVYDRFFGLLNDRGVSFVLAELFSADINSKLRTPICQKHLQAVLLVLKRLVISERLKSAIDILLADIPNAYKANGNKKFVEETRGHIRFG